MDHHTLEKIKAEYHDNDDLIQLYEEWGDSPYLQEVFHILDEQNPEWVKEKELGSWAAEFILDILLEHADELEELSPQKRTDMFREEIEERYADFHSCRRFAYINNLSLQFEEDRETNCEDLEEYMDENGEQIGFPRF